MAAMVRVFECIVIVACIGVACWLVVRAIKSQPKEPPKNHPNGDTFPNKK